MEDIFLSVGVQMDIVNQCERVATGNLGLTYFQGMESASNRYALTKLTRDYTKMRNDIVHEGVLSGSNFTGKNKADCAVIITDHSGFDYRALVERAKLIVDTRNALKGFKSSKIVRL